MPWLGASPRRTLRGITVRNTFSLKNSRTSRRHLLPQVRALVVHRQQHALDVERGIERRADAAHRADEIGEPLEREVLAVERNEHGVGGDERVEREEAERGRAVDEDVIEAIAQGREELAQALLARGAASTSSISAPVRLRSAGTRSMRSTPVGTMKGAGSGTGVGRGQRVVDGAAGAAPGPSGRRRW